MFGEAFGDEPPEVQQSEPILMQFVEFDGQLPCIHFGVVRIMVSRKQELKGLLEIRAIASHWQRQSSPNSTRVFPWSRGCESWIWRGARRSSPANCADVVFQCHRLNRREIRIGGKYAKNG